MPIEVRMPALSPTMERGTLAKWLVAEGQSVASGDAIAEIETDKATMEVEAAEDGRVGRLVVAEGTEDVAVGTVIAVLLEDGETADVLKATPTAPAKAGASASAPKADAPSPAPAQPSVQAPEKTPAPATNGAAAVHVPDDGRILASPLARRLAYQAGIDLGKVAGSGPGGRIIKRDLEKVDLGVKAPAAVSAIALAPVMGPPEGVPYEEIRLSAMRKVIAQRLSLSKQTIPHYYLTIDVELDRLLDLRKELNAAQDIKLSVNDFLIKALAIALKKVPDANVQFGGDKLYKFSRSDVSVAVAIPGGLVTPVIRGGEAKGLAAISAEMKVLAEKARSGKLTPEDYQGGTISLSNLGMYGIKQFDAVINPPQAAILAVGSGESRPVVKDGTFAVATVMTATLSCDHRAIDGATGAQFLEAFKSLIQTPVLMLL